MLRSSLTTAGVLILGASAFAQTNGASRVKPVTGPVLDAGTYHMATHTWTRHTAQANLGADVIYNNTCSTGYYSPFSGDHYVDEGRVPANSANEPNNLQNKPGCATQYSVDGFQLAYCSDQTTATIGTFTINFFQNYVGCATVIGVTPTAGFNINNLPGALVVGTGRCWVLTFDLDAPPQTASLAFTMLADGDGSFTGPSTGGINDMFGWESFSTAPGTGTGNFIAGDPNTCTGYDGTRWAPVINYAQAGTGMSTQNYFRIESGTTAAGCYWFGGTPYASFYLRLFANACGPTATGTFFCPGDGSGTACPCGNNSGVGNNEGCLNSLSTTNGGKLNATGTPSIGGDTVVLTGSGMPNSSCLYFQGTAQQNGGLGSAFGDGLRCAGGTVIRLGTKTNVGGTSSYPVTGDQSVSVKGADAAGNTRTYQAWYRNAAAFCTTATFNLTNGYQIVWTL